MLLLLFLLLGVPPLWAQQSGIPADPQVVITRMEEHNALRQSTLQSYRNLRRYEAGNSRLNRQASALVEMSFTAPDQKSFRILERSGSSIIMKYVIEPLIQTEKNNAAAKERSLTEMCRRNYSFLFLHWDEAGGAYVFSVEPIKPSKFLFRGKIWIDKDNYAIRRMEGEPAKSPSFWVRRTSLVHEYARFGEYWFPVTNRTEAVLKLFGISKLSITYYDYQWQGDPLSLSQAAR